MHECIEQKLYRNAKLQTQVLLRCQRLYSINDIILIVKTRLRNYDMNCNTVCRCVCMYVFYLHILSTVHSPDKRSARHFFSQSATQPAAQPRAQSITDSTPQAAKSEHILRTVHSPNKRSARHFCFFSQQLSQQPDQAFSR